jgi:4-amino-4-deoxy-L-arabinose transferase
MQKSNHLWLLFLVLLFSLFWHLGSWGVTESSEARYAEISREMLEAGNWIRPQYLQILHFDKPLMTYWITAIGLKIFGTNAFAVRFFLQVAFLIQLFLVYKITLELFVNKKLASYAVIIYCGVPLVLISIRNLTTDAYLTTFTLAASLFYILYYKHLRITWLYAFFVCLGMTIFTKGPFGILLPLLMIYPTHQILKPRETMGSKNYHFYIGILISVAIGGWWFFQLMASSPVFYDFFVKQQVIDRVANAENLKRGQPFWYYIAFLPLFILPMLTLFISSLFSMKVKLKPIKGMIMLCILFPLLLFSLSSSKLILYILPIMPCLAIVLAYFLYHLEEKRVKMHLIFAYTIYSLITFTIIGLFLNLLPGIYYKPAFYQFTLLGLLLIYLIFIPIKIKESKRRLLLLFLTLPVCIVPISTDIMKSFEIEINATVPVTDFVKVNHLENQQIMIWNRAVNSIPFQLQKSIYSIKYQHYSLDRNILFQPDSTWQNNLININEKEGKDQVRKLIQSPSVLISADKIPEEYNWLIASFKKKKQMGKWIVYYNNW